MATGILKGPLGAFLLIAVLTVAFSYFLGIAGGIGVAILLALGILYTLRLLKVPVPIPYNLGKLNALVGIGLIAVSFFLGAFANYGLTTASLTGAVEDTSPTASLTNCATSVAPDIRGTSATITLKTTDPEADTETVFTSTTPAFYVYANGVKTEDAATGLTFTTAKVGDTLTIGGGNASRYIVLKENVCVTGQQQTVELKAPAITTEANMEIICYDSTATTALVAADNTTRGDYQLALAAGATEPIYCRFRNAATNSVYELGGVAIGVLNKTTVDDVRHKSFSEFIGTSGSPSVTKVASPSFLKTAVIDVDEAVDGTGTTNLIQGWDYVLKYSSPIALKEFQSFKEQFEIVIDNTNDPVAISDTAPDSAGRTTICALTLDSAYAKAQDGSLAFDIFQRDINEANVGRAENVTSPIGRDTGVCVLIE